MAITAQPNRKPAGDRARAILRDSHFWIPIGVLVAGLILLSRIS
jgi:hypothetical protein